MTDFSDKFYCETFNKEESAYETRPVCSTCGSLMIDLGEYIDMGGSKVWYPAWICVKCETDFPEEDSDD